MRPFHTMAQLRRFWSAYVDALKRHLNRVEQSASDAECRWIDHLPLNACKSPVNQFDRHESFAREWSFELRGLLFGKTEAGIVAGVSDHYHDALALISKDVQSVHDEPATCSLALMFRKNRNRGQSDGGYKAGSGFDPHPAKQDVANDGSLKLSHEGNERVLISPQLINQVRFFRASEGGLVYNPNSAALGGVPGVFNSNADSVFRRERLERHDLFAPENQVGLGRHTAPGRFENSPDWS